MTNKYFYLLKSPTVKKTILYFTVILTVLFIVSHIFYISLFSYFSQDKTDSRLKHEIEHLKLSIEVLNDSLIIVNDSEFNEEDFMRLTEDPFLMQIYDQDRNVLFQSENLKLFPNIPLTYTTSTDEYYFTDIILDDYDLRTVMMRVEGVNNEYYIQLSSINHLFDLVIKRILIFDLITLPFLVFFMMIVGLIFVRKMYLPLNRVINLADEISARNLGERLNFDADPDDDIGRLKLTLNNLFDRLEGQVAEISNFTDNASHQLMTPLTAIQSELDFILRKKRTSEEYQETLIILKEQTSRMINIVKQLLLLTHNDRLLEDIDKVFNLSNLFNNEVKAIYKHKNDIKFEIEESLYLRGNHDFILIVIQNLIDNAVKYSPDDTPIIVKVYKDHDMVFMTFEDFGIGIKEEEKEKIFQRFYRSDSIERQGIRGLGLGLSLVKSITDSLNGKITIDTEREKGTKFIISFPLIKWE